MSKCIHIVVLLLGIGMFCFSSSPIGAQTFLLGDQDYSDGSFVDSNSVWLQAQSDESFPFSAIHTAPATIPFAFAGLPTGMEGVLTISLWDLDTSLSDGNAVSNFSLNSIAQSTDPFARPVANNQVASFQFPIDATYLSNGQLSVSITISRFIGNEVGIDFARLVISPDPASVPEPDALTSLVGISVFASSFLRRKKLMWGTVHTLLHGYTPTLSYRSSMVRDATFKPICIEIFGTLMPRRTI